MTTPSALTATRPAASRVVPIGRAERTRNTLMGLAAGAVLAVVLAAVAFAVIGGRWFVVQTPSMGQAAPVGSLVLDLPMPARQLHAGEVISFRPPSEPAVIFTHRIAAIAPSGAISTRGDVNGSNDPWSLHRSDVIGRAVAILPAAGWVARALPALLGFGAAIWILTAAVREPVLRRSLRAAGSCTLIAVLLVVLKPLENATVITATATPDGGTARVISTGLLPVMVHIGHAPAIALTDGQTGLLQLPASTSTGYTLSISPDLTWLGWIVLALVWIAPLLTALTRHTHPHPHSGPISTDPISTDAP